MLQIMQKDESGAEKTGDQEDGAEDTWYTINLTSFALFNLLYSLGSTLY